MKKVPLISRYLLAAMLLVFGVNKFVGFMEFPEMSGFAAEYMNVIANSYIMPTLGVLYIFAAVLLISNKMVGLATVLVAPLAFNAFMFHLTLDPANIVGALIFVVLTVLVMIGHKNAYKGLLS